jgi:hypothetical protein
MSSEADGGSTYNWTTLRYLVDPQREITVPMGVILWSEEEQRLWFRLPQEGEQLPTASGYEDVPAAQARTHAASGCPFERIDEPHSAGSGCPGWSRGSPLRAD